MPHCTVLWAAPAKSLARYRDQLLLPRIAVVPMCAYWRCSTFPVVVVSWQKQKTQTSSSQGEVTCLVNTRSCCCNMERIGSFTYYSCLGRTRFLTASGSV